MYGWRSSLENAGYVAPSTPKHWLEAFDMLKELIGKTIKNYQVNTTVLPAPKSDVIEIHIITTTTPPAPKPDPHYLIKGREQELTKEEFNKISPSKIKAIEILKEGTKAIQERGLKEDGRSYIIVTLKK